MGAISCPSKLTNLTSSEAAPSIWHTQTIARRSETIVPDKRTSNHSPFGPFNKTACRFYVNNIWHSNWSALAAISAWYIGCISECDVTTWPPRYKHAAQISWSTSEWTDQIELDTENWFCLRSYFDCVFVITYPLEVR